MIRIMRRKGVLGAFCLLAAACFLALCSKSSFLYPMNDWVDVNIYITMGKGMHAGKRIYTDLYDQKGPLLFLVYYLLTAVPNCYLAEYILEVFCFSLFLYCAAQCTTLYVNRWWAPYLTVLALAIIIPASNAFAAGGSVEELCLFMMTYSLWRVLAAIREKRLLITKETIAMGTFAGVILWIKYTMLGFYFGLAVFIIVWYTQTHAGRELMKTIGCFLAGVMMATLPVFVYFAANGTFADLWTAYFYNNLFIYSGIAKEYGGVSAAQLLYKGAKNMLEFAMRNPVLTVLLAGGGVRFILVAHKERRELFAVLLPALTLTLAVFMTGKSYDYYGLALAAFAPLGCIAVLEMLIRIVHVSMRPAIAMVLMGAMTLGGLAADYRLSPNTTMLFKNREEMPQYRFAKTINMASEKASLLNYGFLDGGFYYAAGIIPDCRFFCELNIPLPEMKEMQRRYVEEGLVDFVVTYGGMLTWMGVDDSKYTCIDSTGEFGQKADGSFGVDGYFLYQRN